MSDLIRKGSRTPWGAAQTARWLIEGVQIIHTAGHGGIKLSRERNAKIPAPAREKGGWYEEDCAAAIPFTIFKAELMNGGPDWLKEGLTKHDPAVSWKNWFPESYEASFGVTLQPGESPARDEQNWYKEHADDWVGICAWGDWKEGVPKGMIGVCAVQGKHRERQYGTVYTERYFLVPAKEYAERKPPAFLIKLDEHKEVGKIV